MLMMLVEVIMGVFIANFKSIRTPIISIIVRGLLVAVIGFYSIIFFNPRRLGLFDWVCFNIQPDNWLGRKYFSVRGRGFLTILIRNDFIY